MDNGNYRIRFDNGIKYILGEEIDSKLNNEIEKLKKEAEEIKNSMPEQIFD